MSNAVAVTDATFEQEIEKHDGLAVVDFWATWCGPCRIISPILDQLSAEYEGRVKVSKMDVDANIKTASRFNVRSIPMLLFFKGGKLVDQIVGQQQTVIKKLGEGLGKISGISGGAIMPDGKVSLIVDVAETVRMSTAADRDKD